MTYKLANKKPPLGLVPINIHYMNANVDRFNDVCDAIKRYFVLIKSY